MVDLFMIIILLMEFYVVYYVFIMFKSVIGFYDSYFMFVVKKVDLDGLWINGFLLNVMEIREFFGGEYVGGYVFLLEGIYDICYIFLICVFGGVFYGRGWFEMYGFVIGMRLMLINEVF